MRTTSIALILSAVASNCFGSAVIELTAPFTQGPIGTTIPISVWLTDNSDDVGHYLRLMQLDFSQSELPPEGFQFHYATELCQNFGLCGLEYVENGIDGDLPSSTFEGTEEDTALQVLLPADGAILIGTFEVTIPGPNDFLVDVLNASAPDNDSGARIDFGFGNGDPYTIWSAANGQLTGGLITVSEVPEPASALLLLLAVPLVARRRQSPGLPR